MKKTSRHQAYRYLFGPVASRRLGRSLGVDLVPAKVCSLNCIYCESGSTTHATLERREYIPTQALLRELDAYLRPRPALDTITFSGAGEPTLHCDVGKALTFIKKTYPNYRVALLTNATLFPDPVVRSELRALDLVIPSLDAADDTVAATINRPTAGVSIESIIKGLIAFRRESVARMWLEIFIVPGINDSAQHLAALRDAALRIAPDRVQLNTLDRPGPEPWVVPADRATLSRIASGMQPLAVEIIARHPAPAGVAGTGELETLAERIIGLVRRRPCTESDLAYGLEADPALVNETVRILRKRYALIAEQGERGVFFRLPAARPESRHDNHNHATHAK